MPRLPNFKSDEDAAKWFDEHDTAAYMDEMERVEAPFPIVRSQFFVRALDVRMRSDYLDAIKQIADRQGVPYQMLVQQWLVEKVGQEAPELVT